jgi:hypothetical protein
MQVVAVAESFLPHGVIQVQIQELLEQVDWAVGVMQAMDLVVDQELQAHQILVAAVVGEVT